jgi:Tfp pilus assembly protein PilF
MTTTTRNSTASTATLTERPTFQPIPTRIRDIRTPPPPLVVEPTNDATAEETRERLAALDDKLARIHGIAAEAYLSKGQYEQALPHLEAAAAFLTSDIPAHLQLAFVRYITGDDNAALRTYEAVLGKDPRNGEAWFSLGMVLFGCDKHAEAESCFRHASEITPQDAQVWNNLGVCLWKMGRGADAKVCFQKALQIDANDVDAKFNLETLA